MTMRLVLLIVAHRRLAIRRRLSHGARNHELAPDNDAQNFCAWGATDPALLTIRYYEL